MLGVRKKIVTVRFFECADKRLNFLKILGEGKESAGKLLPYALKGQQREMVFWLKPSIMMLSNRKFFFVLVFLEIIALLGLKSPFSVVSVYAESSFFQISKKLKLKLFYLCPYISLKFDFSIRFRLTVRDPSNREYFSLRSLHSFCVPGECAESI